MKRKITKQLTGVDLLFDICKHPHKYDFVINAPCWIDAASVLIELGYRLPLNQRPIILRKELYPGREKLLSIAAAFKREANIN